MGEQRQHGNVGNKNAAKENGKTSKLIVRLELGRKEKYEKCGNKHFPVRGALSAWVINTLDKQAALDMSDILLGTEGTAVVRDFKRRGIPADKVAEVSQGKLYYWLFNNAYVCELHTGEFEISAGPFINTANEQEIAEHLINTLKGEHYVS